MMTRIAAAPRNSFMNCRQCPHGAAVVAIASSARSPARIAVTTANCSACMLAFKGSPGSSTFTPRYTAPEAPSAAAPTWNLDVGESPVSAPRARTRGGGPEGPGLVCAASARTRSAEITKWSVAVARATASRTNAHGSAGGTRSARSAAEALGRDEQPDFETRDDHRRCLAKGGDGVRATDAIDIGDGRPRAAFAGTPPEPPRARQRRMRAFAMGHLIFFCKSLVTFTYFRLTSTRRSYPSRGSSVPTGTERATPTRSPSQSASAAAATASRRCPGTLRSAAARASAFDVLPFLLEVER